MKINIGIMVAPRPIETVDVTLRSLIFAGFSNDSITCFFEPGDYKTEWKSKINRPDVIFNSNDIFPSLRGKFGNFQNFVQTLRDLVTLCPESDAVMIVEDDAIFSKNVRPLIAREIDSGFKGCLSLYTPNIRQFFEVEKKGFQTITRKYFFGGLAIVLAMDTAKEISQSSDVLNWRGGKRQPPGISPWEREASDAWLGKAVREKGQILKGWNPSLVSHYCPDAVPGGNSARNQGGAHAGSRQAKCFIGENQDAVEFFSDLLE